MGLKFECDVDSNYGVFVTSELHHYILKNNRQHGKFSIEELNSQINERLFYALIVILVILSLIIGLAYYNIQSNAFRNLYSTINFFGLAFVVIIIPLLILFAIFNAISIIALEKELRKTHDILYEKYLGKFEYYKTVVSCPICSIEVKFKDYESLPFQGKCKSCDYIFTVIVDNKRERFYTYGPRGGQHSNAIEYDGIKAIRPKTQRVQYIDKTVNIDESVKIDIKDSIIYKSTIVGRITKD